MSTTPKLNGVFEQARNSLAESLAELRKAETALGELINGEARIEDELAAMKPTFRATNTEQVAKKTALTQQLAEVRAQSRAIEAKTLPRCRESLAMSLTACVSPYREALSRDIAGEKGRLVRTLREFYKTESDAVAAAERSHKLSFWIDHLRVEWSHSCHDVATAQRILARMDNCLKGEALVKWPPVGQSPG
jgi:hypothetical protein